MIWILRGTRLCLIWPFIFGGTLHLQIKRTLFFFSHPWCSSGFFWSDLQSFEEWTEQTLHFSPRYGGRHSTESYLCNSKVSFMPKPENQVSQVKSSPSCKSYHNLGVEGYGHFFMLTLLYVYVDTCLYKQVSRAFNLTKFRHCWFSKSIPDKSFRVFCQYRGVFKTFQTFWEIK